MSILSVVFSGIGTTLLVWGISYIDITHILNGYDTYGCNKLIQYKFNIAINMNDPTSKDQELEDIVNLALKLTLIQCATYVASHINDKNLKDNQYCKIVKKASELGKSDDATNTALLIENEMVQDEALKYILKGYSN